MSENSLLAKPPQEISPPAISYLHIVVPQGLELDPMPALLSRFFKALPPSPYKAQGFEETLLALFGMPDTTPLAPLTALADGIAVGEGAWMRADPITLSADQATVYWQEGVQLAMEEVQALTQSLNDFLQQDGLTLHTPHPERWYLQLKALPLLQTTPLSQSVGNSLDAILPSGKDQAQWRCLFTELQMLLHTHPVNQRRLEQGVPPVSALWFWGQGVINAIARGAVPWRKVWVEGPLEIGLAKATYLEYSTDIATALTEITSYPGAYLAVIDPRWEGFEGWFSEVWDLLKVGKLSEINVYPIDGRRYRLTHRALAAWWRRPLQLLRSLVCRK